MPLEAPEGMQYVLYHEHALRNFVMFQVQHV